MSQENVEIVREHADAYARGDLEGVLDALAPDVVFDFSARPDGGSVVRGHDGVVAAARTWLGTWREYHYETEDVLDGGDRVVLLFRERGRGKGSGAKVEHRGAWVYTLRDGKVVHAVVYADRAAALEAARLRE